MKPASNANDVTDRVRLIEIVLLVEPWLGGTLGGESGRRQITFSEQKLQVSRNSFHK
jgi:hypothetical protein